MKINESRLISRNNVIHSLAEAIFVYLELNTINLRILFFRVFYEEDY